MRNVTTAATVDAASKVEPNADPSADFTSVIVRGEADDRLQLIGKRDELRRVAADMVESLDEPMSVDEVWLGDHDDADLRSHWVDGWLRDNCPDTDQLERLLASERDRLYGTPAASAPSVTVPVTYRRDRLLMEHEGVQVWTLTTDYGNGRGLVWVETLATADTRHRVEVINSNELRVKYPQVERRRDVQSSAIIGHELPHSDRRFV